MIFFRKNIWLKRWALLSSTQKIGNILRAVLRKDKKSPYGGTDRGQSIGPVSKVDGSKRYCLIAVSALSITLPYKKKF